MNATDWTKTRLNKAGQIVLTKKELASLPPLYAQDGKGKNAIAYVHFFTTGGYDFWATEFDPEQGIFFGKARLFETELGYADVQEFISTGIVERDLYWTPKPLTDCGND